MANEITNTWAVSNMTRVVNDGFVVVVDWSCTAASGTYPNIKSAFYGGKSNFENNPSEPGFIPYDQLTEQNVLGWVFEALGAEKQEIEVTLTAKVQAQLNPATAQGVPWKTAPQS
jgi:hypothetical protein